MIFFFFFDCCYFLCVSLVSAPQCQYDDDIEIIRPSNNEQPQKWAQELDIDIPVPQPNLVYHPKNTNPYAVPRSRTPAFDTNTIWDPTSIPSGRGSGYRINGPELYKAVYGKEDVVECDADSKQKQNTIFFLCL